MVMAEVQQKKTKIAQALFKPLFASELADIPQMKLMYIIQHRNKVRETLESSMAKGRDSGSGEEVRIVGNHLLV